MNDINNLLKEILLLKMISNEVFQSKKLLKEILCIIGSIGKTDLLKKRLETEKLTLKERKMMEKLEKNKIKKILVDENVLLDLISGINSYMKDYSDEDKKYVEQVISKEIDKFLVIEELKIEKEKNKKTKEEEYKMYLILQILIKNIDKILEKERVEEFILKGIENINNNLDLENILYTLIQNIDKFVKQETIQNFMLDKLKLEDREMNKMLKSNKISEEIKQKYFNNKILMLSILIEKANTFIDQNKTKNIIDTCMKTIYKFSKDNTSEYSNLKEKYDKYLCYVKLKNNEQTREQSRSSSREDSDSENKKQIIISDYIDKTKNDEQLNQLNQDKQPQTTCKTKNNEDKQDNHQKQIINNVKQTTELTNS